MASKRRMALIAGGAVALVVGGLALSMTLKRRGVESDESANPSRAKPAALQPSEAVIGNTAFVSLGGKLPAGSSREGFAPTSLEGRRVAQLTGPGTVAFRLAPDATRYGVSSVVRLSGASSASLTPSIDGRALSPWPLREGWSRYSSVVDGSSFGEGDKSGKHSLGFAVGDQAPGAVIEVESVTIEPLQDRVAFDVGSDSDGHWVDGFHRREKGAIWSRGTKSAIGVALEPDEAPYRLQVRGRTLKGLDSVAVKASVNGRDVGSVDATTKVGDLAWDIPAKLLVSGANRIDLEYSKTGKPSAFNPTSKDARELALRISAVELAPAE